MPERVFEGKRSWGSGVDCDPSSPASQTRESKGSTEDAEIYARNEWSVSVACTLGIARMPSAHLDIEIGGITEHSSDGLRLGLHVHLLDLPRLKRLVPIRLLLGLSKGGGKRGFGRLSGSTGQYGGHVHVRSMFQCSFDGTLDRWRQNGVCRRVDWRLLCAR